MDTATLLNNTNVSIKNLNHSLMKLVAVQQQSLEIAKGSTISEHSPEFLFGSAELLSPERVLYW